MCRKNDRQYDFEVALGSVGSSWDRLWVILESVWGNFDVILGSLWGHLGITLGPSSDHFGSISKYLFCRAEGLDRICVTLLSKLDCNVAVSCCTNYM